MLYAQSGGCMAIVKLILETVDKPGDRAASPGERWQAPRGEEKP